MARYVLRDFTFSAMNRAVMWDVMPCSVTEVRSLSLFQRNVLPQFSGPKNKQLLCLLELLFELITLVNFCQTTQCRPSSVFAVISSRG
jgi:hypothetical protein